MTLKGKFKLQHKISEAYRAGVVARLNEMYGTAVQ